MVLKGLGTTVALPLLDGMVPALSAVSKTAAAPVRRFTVIYAAHGALPGTWAPKTVGAAYELTEPLEPLAAFREQMLVLSGIDNDVGLARLGDPLGGHGRMPPAFMCGVHAKPTQGADFEAGISIDQIAANHVGRETQVPSLQISLDSMEFSGTCDSGYSCVYTNTLSWRNPTMPLPMENNPRAVFERLFGDSGSSDPAARVRRLQEKRSILDSVLDTAMRLSSSVGPSDRRALEDYLESIRDIERRIQTAEAQSDRELPLFEQPAAAPPTFAEYCRLMFDLQVLAYQADLTRITTFMLAKDSNQRTFPEIGVSEGHHALSHHMHVPEKMAMFAKINPYLTTMLAQFLAKLQSTPDGEGSLLDHAIILYGSGHGDANIHEPKELPILVLGGGAGQLKGGSHIRYDHAQLPDLHVTLLHKFGVPIERVGSSDGALSIEPGSGTAV
jgi:hypothetical protein